ncbi:hypothetical protein [Pedobacter rhizosphaerae]|uniref:Uncharacterized protein n=1 Tax=Pedobacter rhizosphaerae TaxID=390241 RepID=A0A1H9KN29_9SPHI|nr:hypothetical protein [Pedobacter rhizosphaerae]SER00571.1 hypothetical protein SAMN04488023_10373 [Pedobacter rhizosphaerae]
MAKTTLPISPLNLVHNIASTRENTAQLETLLNRLKTAEVGTESLRLLKTDASELILQNVSRSESLTKFKQIRPGKTSSDALVVRRESPFSALTDLQRAGSLSIAGATETLGPFTAEDGRIYWYDFLTYEKLIPVYLTGEAAPLMLIPLKLAVVSRPGASYTLAKGSIWIRAGLFASAAGNTKYTGFKISSGKLNLSKATGITSNTLKISADTTLALELILDNTFELKGDSVIGSDSRSAGIKLPEHLNLQYANKKITISQMDNASWRLYGDSRQFTYRSKPAVYNADLDKVFIPLQSDLTEFRVQEKSSEFFDIDGAAPVRDSLWCLSLAALDITKPFTIRNNGALGVLCRPGLSCSWQGLKLNETISLKGPYLLAEPGLFLIHENSADFNGIREQYKLWDLDPVSEIKASLTLSFMKKKRFDYSCLAEGAEAVSAFADAVVDADKPIKADGVPVAPRTKDSIYIKYITPTLSQMMVYDQDMISENAAQPSTQLVSEAVFLEQKKASSLPYQFALENAYLLTTPPAAVMLTGYFDTDNIITKGNLTILYGLLELIPTLPHPYTSASLFKGRRAAASFRDAATYNQSMMGLLTSTNLWQKNPENLALVDVDFKLLYNQAALLPMAGAAGAETSTDATGMAIFTSGKLAEHLKRNADRLNNSAVFRSPNLFSLLDLSTNYDLLGVSMSFNQVRVLSESIAKVSQTNEQLVTIEKMNLRTPMALLNGFTLPQVSWEPLINISKPDVSADPDEGLLSYSDQGPATIFNQFDPEKIDIDPLKYIQRFKYNLKPAEDAPFVKQKNYPSSILFSLPNGKISMASLRPFNPGQATMNNRHLDFIQPAFDLGSLEVTGGLQFRISANKATSNELPPELNGFTIQLKNLTDNGGNPLPQSILGESVHTIFNGTFATGITATGVPLTHIDFSGYGASTYSNWLAPLAKYADIAQVKFDIMRGRVSHEIVQAVSMIYPYGICVVRTITFYRRNNAIIFREDSGWVAKSPGTFDFSFRAKGQTGPKNFQNPYIFHPGLTTGIFNAVNIKEVENDYINLPYTPSNGEYFKNNPADYVHESGTGPAQTARFVGVTFDADVDLDADGKGTIKRVAGKQFKGYLQLLPQGVPVPERVFSELMERNQKTLGGNIDTILNLGGSEQKIQVSRLDVTASFQNGDQNDAIFVAAARGSVQLPADGSWSIVQLDKSSGDVQPMTDKQSVPIIRAGERNRNGAAFTLSAASKVTKVAFPEALKNSEAIFAKRFGFLQNTGTQKLLLGDPSYDTNQIGKLLTEAPLLADSFRLLNSKGPFPNLGNSIRIEDVAQAATKILENGLEKVITDFKLPDNFSFDIIGKDGDPFHMYIKYESEDKDGGKENTLVSYLTNSAGKGNWDSQLKELSIVVDLASFKSLMTISGDLKANISANPGFDSGKAPQLKLAEPLEKIYQILEFLDNLDPSQPVEAIKKGLQIAMSNNADSWDYKFKASKEIPLVKFPFDPINYNSPTTPLKLDAFFKIGCYFNQPIRIPNTIDQLMPSAGAFLELGADLRVMCVSLAAATVYATGRAEVGLAADLKSPPTLYFKFGFGIELCVGLPVIGSVAVLYMVGVDMSLNTQQLTVGAFIYFRGRAEIFGGIVTITIAIEAAGKIQKQFDGGPTSCIAMCTFALDISIFWVIDISFTETWEETRQIA